MLNFCKFRVSFNLCKWNVDFESNFNISLTDVSFLHEIFSNLKKICESAIKSYFNLKKPEVYYDMLLIGWFIDMSMPNDEIHFKSISNSEKVHSISQVKLRNSFYFTPG